MPAKRAGGARGLTPAANARVRAALVRLMKERNWSQTDLEPKLDVRQASLSRFLTGSQGTSFPTAQRVASLLGIDVMELIEPSSGARVLRVPVDDAYPTRPRAIAAAEILDCSAEDVQVVADAHDSTEDPGDVYWITEFLRARDRRRRREAQPASEAGGPISVRRPNRR